MAHVEDFTDLAVADLRSDDFFYVRRTSLPSNRDARFGFSALMRGLFGAADNTAARSAIGIITAVATLDFPSIAANAKADLTIGVVGANGSDSVILGLPSAPAAGLVFQAFVSAANVVTVRASNTSSGAVDAASANYRVTVLKSS